MRIDRRGAARGGECRGRRRVRRYVRHVTKAGDGRCRWCGSVLAVTASRGRPPRYCRRSCRQRHYEERQRLAAERRHDAGEHELRVRLETLEDQIFVLLGAIGDAERLAARASDPDDHRVALTWVLEAARPLVS
jgi:hypothetical protein